MWLLPRPAQDRAIAIMRSPKLRTWIQEASISSTLFINANQVGASNPSQFCIPVVSAKLIESIQTIQMEMRTNNKSTLVLSFFCARHTRPSVDQDAGPAGALRSLTTQLLLVHPCLDMARLRSIHKDMDYDDVEALCDMFESLIEQLPAKSLVFCVIDSISCYEDIATWNEDTKTITQRLVMISEGRDDRRCLFKLLLTSPRTSRALYQYIEDQENVLWMESRVLSTGGFVTKQWASPS